LADETAPNAEGAAPGRQRRVRLALFAAFVGVVVSGTVAFVLRRPPGGLGGSAAAPVPSAAVASREQLAAVRSAPHVYYRSARDGEFGRIVVAALGALETRRAVTALRCDRFYFAGGRGSCLRNNPGELHPPAHASFVDAELGELRTVPMVGVPSRTRMSPDGRLAATTVFVTGDSYEAEFSTRTNLFELERPIPRNLEFFEATKDGQAFRGVDFNYWGVSFARDSNAFYATLATAGTSYLVVGDATKRTVRVLRPNGECPSLSPNQRRLAFKIRGPNRGGFLLRVLELESGEERAVSTAGKSVDDQVEWLDDDHLLYGYLDDKGLPRDAMNVWVTSVVPGDATPPRPFIRGASSPVVVR
jgi:hypothetical protein